MRSECLLKMSPAIVTSSPELCPIVCYKDDLAYKPSAMFSKPKYPLKIQIKTWSGKMTNNPYKASVYIALSNKNNFFVGYQPCPSPSIHKWTSLHCDLPQVCNIRGLAWSLNKQKNVWKVTKFIHKLFHIYNETIPACPLAFIIDNRSSLYAWTQESETRLCKNFT